MERLTQLRKIMSEKGVDAYIIPYQDDHQSEYLCEADKRLAFISGFTGSAGTGVVTQTEAALWTDTRYYIQAEKQMSKDWKLMRAKDTDTPTVAKWLTEKLEEGGKVSTDPKKVDIAQWKAYTEGGKLEMVLIKENFIDQIWKDRPSYPEDKIYVHDVRFAGEEWTSKVKKVREAIGKSNATALVVTALDEIAWLLNLRGTDINYNPVFRSYLILTEKNITLYINQKKVTEDVKKHLTGTSETFLIKDYDGFWTDLEDLGKTENVKVFIPSATKTCPGASYLITSSVPEAARVAEVSPIVNLRAYKNNVEVEGSRRAHVKDAVALCQVMQILEKEVPAGVAWDEMKVSKALDIYRGQQEFNKGNSFEAIVAYGKNAALPHYTPKSEAFDKIDTVLPIVIDSGGQYLDGTIDTTRVLHLGEPTEVHKTVYTALLKGCIDLVTTVFPENTTLKMLDFIIRRPLFKIGRDYGHGSTHGTGVFLGVHETFDQIYAENFIGSQEPGFYKSDDFGMRLENLVVVIPAPIENHTSSKNLFTFDPLTLVPYELKLINPKELDKCHVDWLNDYHKKVLDLVGAEMMKQGKTELFEWLKKKTMPIQC